MIARKIKENELSELLKLYEHLHNNDDPLPSAKIVDNVWKEIFQNQNIEYFGVFDSSLLISSCTITLIPNLTRSCRPYGIIENVVTHSEYRKNGYGKMVLKAALDFAWQNNCYKVMLMTGRLNEGTFKFYESAGFDRNSKQAFINYGQ